MTSVARASRIPLSSKSAKLDAPSQQPSPLAELKEKLTRNPRAHERKFALNALKECTSLRSIPLGNHPDVPSKDEEWARLEEDTCTSPINVNGVTIGPGSPASSRIEVRRILMGLCEKLTAETGISPETLYHTLMVRLAGSVSQAEAHETLVKVMGSSSFVFQVPNNIVEEIPIVAVTIYESDGDIHATFDHYHLYGMYRKLSETPGGKPWIKLNVVLHERCNLSTGASVRSMEVRLPRK